MVLEHSEQGPGVSIPVSHNSSLDAGCRRRVRRSRNLGRVIRIAHRQCDRIAKMPDWWSPVNRLGWRIQNLLSNLEPPFGDAVAENLAAAVRAELHAETERRRQVFGSPGNQRAR